MYIAIISILTILLIVLYLAWVRGQCTGLVLTFLLEVAIIRNVPVDKMPKLILKKSLDNIGTIHILARLVASWYIRRYGEKIASSAIVFIHESIRADENIQVLKR